MSSHQTRPPALGMPSLERAASSWLGRISSDQPELETRWQGMDQAARAAVAQLYGGLSPVSMALAWADWTLHLALAPGKQAQLIEKALKKSLRWSLYAHDAMQPNSPPCIAPLPQDRRFDDPAWRQWPFNLIAQGFLLTQQWWHVATTGVPGVSRHHEDMLNFGARQWLDRLAPANFISTNPVVQAEALRTAGASLWQGGLNALDDAQRQLSGQVPVGAEAYAVGRNLATTPGRVVMKNRLAELIQYSPATPEVHREPVLIVSAWIMKYYVLDLSPHHSLIRYLVEHGHTVFALSWKNPDPSTDASDRELSMDDYRLLGVMAALDAIQAICAGARVHLVGYCLGGTLTAIAAAQMARDGDARLASLSLLAAQVDFEEPGEISLFIDESQVSFLEDTMREHGVLDGKQMAGAFQMLRSNDLIWSYRLQNYLLGRRQAMTELMAWNVDATRMPQRMHSDYLRQLFLDNQLAEGRYGVGAGPVSLGDIQVPIFAVGTLTDHIAPWRSVYKIQRLCETELCFALASGGHNAGIVAAPGTPGRSHQVLEHRPGEHHLSPDAWLSTAAHHADSWWTSWQPWLARHSSPPGPPPTLGCAAYPARDAAPGSYVRQR